MKNQIKLPQIIISLFLIALVVTAGALGMNMKELFNESLLKFGMNGVFVLAMIPMINAGVGMNFGLTVGITAGLLGMCCSIQMRLTGLTGFLTAIVVAAIVAVFMGFLYGLILNKVKGEEDIAAIFIGYSLIPIMNLFWTVAPFTNREMLYPVGGSGLRPKISLDNYFGDVLQKMGAIHVNGITIPVGLLVFYGIIAAAIMLFFKSRAGNLMLAVGENEEFCNFSGVNINKVRIIAVIMSTVIGAIGICVYAQTYGFVELYGSSGGFSFPAVSSILIGGCFGKRANIFHAILGTYLYQTIYLMSAPIANMLLIPQMAEILRMIITNSIILFAFLKREGEKRR